jgi:hypothetical protein
MEKIGNTPDEYEDSFSYNIEMRKFAVADGVSEACFSKLWSNILTECFVNSDYSLFSHEPLTSDSVNMLLLSILQYSQKEWIERIDWRNLPFYVERKAKRGAFATFLGFEVKEEKTEEGWRWRAIAVGDCCLFQIGDKITDIFPRYKSTDFGNEPSSLPSIPSPEILKKCKVEFKEGIVKKEKIILSTDALAKWIIEQYETGKDEWKKILFMQGKDMRSFFEKIIEKGEMKNDDLTLLLLDF